MSFHYEGERLFVEEVAADELAARFSTPTFVYSRAIIEKNFFAYHTSFGARRHRICYSVKANGNLGVLDCLARAGAAFDIVSGGELERVIAAGGDRRTVTFAGVGKTRREMAQALTAEIACFNVESHEELELLDEVARETGTKAPIAVRVNPDVDAATHPYISTGLSENKFGIPMDEALAVYRRAAAMDGIRISGVACHIGSQLTTIAPSVDAAQRVMHLVSTLSDVGIEVDHVDIGGGLGIAYNEESPPSIESYVRALCEVIPDQYEIVMEPGRSIVGPAGILLSEVLYLKETPLKTFAICDAAMTELIRPALYQAHHDVLAVMKGGALRRLDLVGPVCESADFLARDRELAVKRGELVAIMDCGAYSAVMATNYNARPRPAEILVDGTKAYVVRERENLTQLFAGESRLPGN